MEDQIPVLQLLIEKVIIKEAKTARGKVEWKIKDLKATLGGAKD
jgi:hypothetical protein